MKPIRLIAATILCQSILLSPVAMAKKERFGETRKNKDKQEEKQDNEKKEQPAETGKKDAQDKKAKSKSDPAKRDVTRKSEPKKQESRKQAPNKPAAEKKRDQPVKASQTKDKASNKDVSGKKDDVKQKVADKKDKADVKPMPLPGKRPDTDKKDLAGKKDDVKQKVADKKDKADIKPMPLPGKRPDNDKQDLSGKRDDVKQKLADKKDKADVKPMPLPGKRPDNDKRDLSGKRDDVNQKLADKKDKADKKDDAKQKLADKRDDLKDKNAARKDDSKNSAKNTKKPAQRMALPGDRPKVSDAERTARAERLQKEANKRQAERKIAAAKADRKTSERRAEIVKAGQNSRKVRRPDVRNNTKNNNWWTSNKRITNNNKDVRVRNTTVNNTTVINKNFERRVNWTTRERDWGYNPWWNRQQTRPWYGSSWNGNWNRDYYRRSYHRGYNNGYYDGYRPPGYSSTSVVSAIGWGLIGWSLGTMVYDTGYHRYQNPYPVSTPVYYGSNKVDYTQPITRVAVQTAPEDDNVLVENTARSESIIAESQDAFRERNYLVALELADKAIAESPGDGALHEYRALVLFALGKYGDAAGVLNPVLASGPGWDWGTMIALYDSQQTYTDQLLRLESYSEQHPDSADTHFLLGYHYMVCGHTDLATPQFDMAAKLMPADSVSRQLAELTSASADSDDEEADTVPAEEIEDLPDPEPIPLEKLTGTWTSTREDGSTVTLRFGDDGKFTWNYAHDGETSEFSGDYSMNDDGLLVLDSEDSQMVATVELPEEQEMNFVLAGGPPEDPGLDFTKG